MNVSIGDPRDLGAGQDKDVSTSWQQHTQALCG